MIGRAGLVQSLLLGDDELKEENGLHHKVAVARGVVTPGNSHFKLIKIHFKKEISGSSVISMTVNFSRCKI